ncbi:hypothetical protein VSR34_38880, partial [Paraburkholderia sp. JHI2823]|uniref:hypothetical protein n=1 Tax=Paraburkholderia sp. JHI2823 TaxID=3112960 RepID=UPI00317BFFD1
VTMLKCLWNLCRKTNNLLVKWIHMYCLKGSNVMDAIGGTNWSWVINNIMKQRDITTHVAQTWDKMLAGSNFSMKDMYKALIDDNNQVPWRHLISKNNVRPRAILNL